MDDESGGETTEESRVLVEEGLSGGSGVDVCEGLTYGGCGGEMREVFFGREILVRGGCRVEVHCLWRGIVGSSVVFVMTVQ